MKIYLNEIRPQGLNLNYDIGAEDVGLDDRDFLYLIEPLHVKAHFERIENTVLLKAKINSRYKSYCSRSLVDVERDFSYEFLLDFPIRAGTEFIEPNEDIRQEVLLNLPMKVLCDEELKKEEELKKVAVGSGVNQYEEETKTYQPFANLRLKEE